ncbi:transcriptional regulator [Streptomyces sp. CBMA156]|nr:transcriptional regulator [Streptomyces sp. CBMA156]
MTDGVPTATDACGAAGPGPCRTVDLALNRVFTLLGKRWTGMLLGVLTNGGPAYFSELRRAVPGISERMLSDRLTELAEAGLVVREVDAGPPLRVSYRLTEAGIALKPALTELAVWADRHLPEGVLKGGC